MEYGIVFGAVLRIQTECQVHRSQTVFYVFDQTEHVDASLNVQAVACTQFLQNVDDDADRQAVPLIVQFQSHRIEEQRNQRFHVVSRFVGVEVEQQVNVGKDVTEVFVDGHEVGLFR